MERGVGGRGDRSGDVDVVLEIEVVIPCIQV